MRTLHQRMNMRLDDAQTYLSRVVPRCNLFVTASVPHPLRKVVLLVLNRSFNDVVMVNHFYIDQVRIFHAMKSYSRFSAARTAPDATLNAAPLSFESVWDSLFCPLETVHSDQAFSDGDIQKYLKSHGISFRPVPSRFHRKNTL